MTPPIYRDTEGNQLSLMDGRLYVDIAGQEVGSVALTPQLETLIRNALIGDPQ